MLYITNGDAFNAHLQKEKGVIAIPFREAMMAGEVPDAPIFSDAFIRVRAHHHGVAERVYRTQPADPISKVSANSLSLYFGRDTFCQMNLLTLLAYLEELEYAGKIFLTLIDDETFSVLKENIPVPLGGYRDIYKTVLIKHEMPTHFGVIDERSVSLFFDYLSAEGFLAQTVRKHSEESEIALITRLLTVSADYGLSDTMAKDLIEKYKA